MNILTISGSSQKNSSNSLLLKKIPSLFPNHTFAHIDSLAEFPLFSVEKEHSPPEIITCFEKRVQTADIVVICTPEYLHNIPAVLKNALEWTTRNGSFNEKKILPITYTPHPPRGKQAMESLVWSLQALNANIIAQLHLYKSELRVSESGFDGANSVEEIKTIFELMM
jgi:chromate reductase, NAD(P)H dehydrogenase (quinone)